MQLSFKVETFAELRELKSAATAFGCTDLIGLNHGNAWSIYFNDPEQNRVEIYMDTSFHTPQPCGDPLDIEKSEEELHAETALLIARRLGSRSRDEYVAAMAERLS